MSALRRSVRRALPRRDGWHSLQEYALGEKSQEEFRLLRQRDAIVTGVVNSQKTGQKTIDWNAWEQKIGNKEVFNCLKEFHTQQSALLDAVIAEDHLSAVKSQVAGWELFDDAVKSCQASVEKSQDLINNGSRALWISFQNPPISLLTQSEWLDADQYWQAFVEKHHFYHNHLCSAVEDPESKEYDAKQKADLITKWEKFDGRGLTRQNNKLLYQRPSYEYYDYLRGPLVEHMIFYLTKTGGDARFFPQNMPVQWFAEIYSKRFKIYNVLQRRKRIAHESSVAREATHDYHCSDLDHDGEGHFAKLIAREAAITELSAARLMGNYILFSDEYVPVQTGSALYRALQMDDGKGTFYSLGSDVHCLFYKPAGGALTTPNPTECFVSLANHAQMTGRRFEPGYAAAMESFTEILESRKEGLGGAWFNAPGESSRDTFMRRLKKDDPSTAIFKAYATEHAERWAAAKTVTVDDALQSIQEIERKYQLECTEYDNVLFGISDEFSGAYKLEIEDLLKLSEVDKLQAELDSSNMVAVDASTNTAVKNPAAVTSAVKAFETSRDKAVEQILALKVNVGK